jgi:hypothetical protein
MNYSTTVNKDFAGATTLSLPLWVSPTDFPLRIRTHYEELGDSIELLLDFQRGHEHRIPLKMQPVELEVGEETGRVYRCLVHDFAKEQVALKHRQLLRRFKDVLSETHERSTFLFCLEALSQTLIRERERSEQHAGQVSSEAAPSAPPDEPSA